MNRIKLTDTTMDVVVKMADGNPGAMSAMMDCLKNGKTVDPNSAMGGLGPILSLDALEIYGTDIYVLYSDICERDIVKFLAILRANQLGYLSADKLKDAAHRQDYSGKEILTPELIDSVLDFVQKKLPKFAKDYHP